MDRTVPPLAAIRQTPGRIVFLDVLRVVAVAGVLIGHKYVGAYSALMGDGATHASLRFLLQLCYPLIDSGGAGVVIFFLVSGYIIPQVLLRETTVQFLVRRVFRIYPLYLCALAASVVVDAAFGAPTPSWWVLLQQASLFGNFFGTPDALHGVEWTLRIEVLFYLYIAALDRCGLLHGRWSRALPWVLVASILALFLAPVFPGRWTLTCGYLNLFAPYLLLGTALFLMQQQRLGWGTAAAIVALVQGGHWLLMPQVREAFIGSHFSVYGLLVFLVFFGLRERIRIGPVWRGLAEITYAMYLFHNWLYDAIANRIALLTPSPRLTSAVSLLLLLACCWLASMLVERPAIRWGHRISARFARGSQVQEGDTPRAAAAPATDSSPPGA